jgi:predicted exporter
MTIFTSLTFHSTISIGVAQTIFINSLSKHLRESTSDTTPEAVLAAGATRLETLNLHPKTLQAVQSAFSFGVVNTIIFALVLSCIAVPMAFAMEWKNVKKVAAEREKDNVEGVDGVKAITDEEKAVP